MSRENVSAYRYLRGIKEPLSGADEKAFDVKTEAMREAEDAAAEGVSIATKNAMARLSNVKDSSGNPVIRNIFSPQNDPAVVGSDEVKAAMARHLAVRARNVMLSLGTAAQRGTFEDMLSALELIGDRSGDPILGIKGMPEVAHATVVRLRALAGNDAAKVEQLNRLLGANVDEVLSGAYYPGGKPPQGP
jgi:hypothetical protein